MSILKIDLVVPNGWTRQKLVHMKRFHEFFFQANFSIFTYISVSSHCVPFIFETCQTFAGISTMIEQFHDFLKFTFGAFLQFGPTVPRVIKNSYAIEAPPLDENEMPASSKFWELSLQFSNWVAAIIFDLVLNRLFHI